MEKSEEYKIFLKHYPKLHDTLTDINTLLPHFVAENIISLDDIDGNAVTSKKTRNLLLQLSGPLRAGHTQGFYTLLRIMGQYGTQATQELATKMGGLLPMLTTGAHSSGRSFKLLQVLGKICNLQSIGIIVINNSETRA